MGGTPLMEQYVFLNDVRALLEDKNIDVRFKKVGDNMTSRDLGTFINID